MLTLGQTTALLARQRNRLDRILSDADTAPGRLAAVKDFGPNPGNLRMFRHVPAGLADGAPLVVALHGCTQTAAGFDGGAGWSGLADRFGFALLVPEQKATNNPQRCFSWFAEEDMARGAGEPASIHAMVERMIADHALDRRRVFITGLSAGGAMTAVMLATYPEVFAGGAIIAGLPYRAATGVPEAFEAMFQGRSRPATAWGDLVRAAARHAGPWPTVSVWHGAADAVVVPANAREIVRQWTDVHGLDDAAPLVEQVAANHTRSRWRDGRGAVAVELNLIAGMDHGVPLATGDGERASGTAGPYMLDVGVPAPALIAESWGLTTVTATAPPRRAADPAAPPPRADGHGLAAFIQSTIAKAFAAAGLKR